MLAHMAKYSCLVCVLFSFPLQISNHLSRRRESTQPEIQFKIEIKKTETHINQTISILGSISNGSSQV